MSFGGFGMGRFIDQMQRAKEAPTVRVTEKKLAALFRKSGLSTSEVRMQMKIARVMGGAVLIGDTKYEITPRGQCGASTPAKQQRIDTLT